MELEFDVFTDDIVNQFKTKKCYIFCCFIN